jgi:hypothetical protein
MVNQEELVKAVAALKEAEALLEGFRFNDNAEKALKELSVVNRFMAGFKVKKVECEE